MHLLVQCHYLMKNSSAFPLSAGWGRLISVWEGRIGGTGLDSHGDGATVPSFSSAGGCKASRQDAWT